MLEPLLAVAAEPNALDIAHGHTQVNRALVAVRLVQRFGVQITIVKGPILIILYDMMIG